MPTRWIRLRPPGRTAAKGATAYRLRRPRPGLPEAFEVFDEDPGLPDAFASEAHVELDGDGPVAFFAVLHRRPDLDHTGFSAAWRDHARFGRAMTGVTRYVQHHVADGPCDGVDEMLFESEEALRTAFAADWVRVEARADEERFLDHGTSVGGICDPER